jgi:hypothetical protein
MAAHMVCAFKVFEIIGKDEAAKFELARQNDGKGSFIVLREDDLETGFAFARDFAESGDVDFTELYRATPPQWN